MRALIADDSTVSRRILIGILQHDCAISDIVQADDGEEALRLLQNGEFGVVFLDWNMPKMEGIDVLSSLREQGITTPVIMVTGEKDKEHVMRAFSAGANDYIVKPFTPKRVAERVRRTLDYGLAPRRSRRLRRALVADDSAVLRRLLASILKDRCSFGEVIQAGDGAEAVEAAAEGGFDLILLDWNMPNMQGIDALRAIRASDRNTPVIMVTSEKEGTRIVEAIDAGANNYIIKPFEPVSLAEKLKQVLRLSK